MNKLTVLTEIWNELKTKGISQEEARFGCYNDNLFSYYYEDGLDCHQFSFACEDTLLSNMPIKELLNLKRLTFFDYHHYRGVGEHKELVGDSIMWSAHDETLLN